MAVQLTQLLARVTELEGQLHEARESIIDRECTFEITILDPATNNNITAKVMAILGTANLSSMRAFAVNHVSQMLKSKLNHEAKADDEPANSQAPNCRRAQNELKPPPPQQQGRGKAERRRLKKQENYEKYKETKQLARDQALKFPSDEPIKTYSSYGAANAARRAEALRACISDMDGLGDVLGGITLAGRNKRLQSMQRVNKAARREEHGSRKTRIRRDNSLRRRGRANEDAVPMVAVTAENMFGGHFPVVSDAAEVFGGCCTGQRDQDLSDGSVELEMEAEDA